MRTLAIGDIHGCHFELNALLAAIVLRPGDTLITLGDYIDRGPNSRGVLHFLIELSKVVRLIPVLGNHEQMLLEARNNPLMFHQWMAAGGNKTLLSYGEKHGNVTAIPADHWRFLEACVPYHETDTHIFVHANCYSDMPLAQQPDYMLRWERFDRIAPHESGKTIICGHTPQRSARPANRGFAICIDTKAHATATLTCLEVGSGKVWQTHRGSPVSISHISDFDDV